MPITGSLDLHPELIPVW